LRQDPDVIMVGEIRDAETAEIAVRSALTGHLLLATLHTNDAAGAVPRLLDMEVEPFLLSSALAGVVAQRLVRRVCDRCKATADVPRSLRDELGLSPDARFLKGRGCVACGHSGYKGRVGLFEVLGMTDALRERIDDVWRSIVPAAVLCITVEPEQVRAMRAAGVPLVLPLYGGGDDIQAIAMDSERVVVSLQLQTLLDAGHERIAFATLDSAHRLTTASRQLLLPEVAASLGIEQPPRHVFPEDPEAVAAQLRALVSEGYTAICAINDHVAGVVLAGARQAGLAVPDELAVIGAGDQVLSALTEPALTTVASDTERLAESLDEVVTRRINQLPAPEEVAAPRASLIRRGSV
jgi:hypothetical protein